MKQRLIHAVKIKASKWFLGVSMCNKNISSYTLVSYHINGVTRPTCLKRMEEEKNGCK